MYQALYVSGAAYGMRCRRRWHGVDHMVRTGVGIIGCTSLIQTSGGNVVLPTTQTQFFGRETEQQQALQILLAPTCHLMTIIGPGGVGKTRFALQLADGLSEHFRDGIHYLDLLRLDAATMLPSAIASILGLSIADAESTTQQLIDNLAEKEMLLLLDNFEHLLDAASTISAITGAAPGVTVLTTSREALRLQEEHVFTLGGLSTPAPDVADDAALQHSAVQLFVDRARRARHDFDAAPADVAAICRLVDGVPLAIELAAVWARVLDAPDILREIQHCIDFLATDLRNVPARHRSIRAIFDGTWEQLSEAEQRTLSRLSIFQNGFNRAAAEDIAGTTLLTLSALRDKSLLTVSAGGRYSLHELIRQFAHEKLEAEPETCLQTYRAHSAHYAGCAGQFAARLRGPQQIQALADMGAEIQNIRAGWTWAVDNAPDSPLEPYILGVALYYQMHGRNYIGVELMDVGEDRLAAMPSAVRVQIELLRAWMLVIVGRNKLGVSIAWGALEALTPESTPPWLGMALVPILNQPEILAERYAVVKGFVEQALKTATDPWERAWLLKAIGEADLVAGNYEVASQQLKASAKLFLDLGERWGATWSFGSLGFALFRLGRHDEAEHYYRQNLDVCADIGDHSGVIDTLHKLATVAFSRGDVPRTESLIMQAVHTAVEYNAHPTDLTYVFDVLAKVRLVQGRLTEAVEQLAMLIDSKFVQKGWRRPEVDELVERLDTLQTQLAPVDYTAAALRGKSTTLVEAAAALVSTVPESTVPLSDTAVPIHIEPLTERETEILGLIAQGHTNRQIADDLTLAIGTVKAHAHNIYAKLGVYNRTAATIRARELNLV